MRKKEGGKEREERRSCMSSFVPKINPRQIISTGFLRIWRRGCIPVRRRGCAHGQQQRQQRQQGRTDNGAGNIFFILFYYSKPVLQVRGSPGAQAGSEEAGEEGGETGEEMGGNRRKEEDKKKK